MSNKPRKDDTGLINLGMMAILIGVFCGLWFMYKQTIVYESLNIAWHVLGFFDLPWMPSLISKLRQQAAQMAQSPQSVSFEQLTDYLNQVGWLFVWIPILMTINGIRVAMKHVSNQSKRRVTVHTLPWIMSKHSPAIIPSLYYGAPDTLLLNVDPAEHRSAQTPTEWVQEHRLLVNGRLDKTRTLEVLKQSLGPKVTSLQDLSAPEKALFAVFASRIFEVKKANSKAQDLLDALNISCHHHTWNGLKGYPDLSITNTAFEHYAQHPDAQSWLKKHPYPRTLLHAMHKQAAKAGKLPSSHFRWLKGMDRSLWYSLNNTGRKVAFVESAAVFTQTQWEEFCYDMGYAFTQPFLEDAIEAIEQYLIKVGLIQHVHKDNHER